MVGRTSPYFGLTSEVSSTMTDVSSENRKVDEFLQTLDKLSQERLMDDQKRQWQLERDIEGLSNESPKRPSLSSRASSAGHDIKELVFNRTASARNKFQDKWKNREKSLEYASDEEFDEDGYQLPYRPRTNRRQSRRAANKDMEIELPRRNSSLTHLSDEDMDLDFGLKRPVARKTSSLKSWVSKDSEESLESPRTPKGERPGFMKSMKGSFSDMRGSISEMNVKGSFSDMKGSLSELKKKKSFSEMKGTLKKKSSFTEMKGSFTDMERRIRRRGVSEEGRESDDSRETKEKKLSKKEARRQARILNLEDRTNVWRADDSEEEEEVPKWKAMARAQRQDNSWIAEGDEEDSEESEAEMPTRSVREYLHSRQMSEDSELEMAARARNGRLNRVISEDSEVELPTRGSRNGRLNRQISHDSSEVELPTRFSRSARQNQISEESEESEVELPTRAFKDTRKKQAVWTADDSDEDPMSKPPKPAKPVKPVKPLKAFKPEEKEEPKEAKRPWSKPEAPRPRTASSTSSFNGATSAPKPKPAFRKPEPKTFAIPEPKAEKPEPSSFAKPEKPEKPSVKSVPPKPAKLSSKAYEEKDSQELKDRILKLSPTKASAPAKPAKLSTKEYEEKDSQELKNQLEKLANKKQPPAKPAKLSKPASKDGEAEAIGALHSLKPTKPAALKTAPKPEALQKFSSMKAEKAAPKNFQAELSGILRSSTEPSLQKGPTNASSVSLTESKPPTTTLKKSWTEPTLSEISHITKSRSKGPRRRLPKSASLTSSLAFEKSEAEADPEPKSKPEPKPEPTVAEKPKGKVPPAKPAKKPPPIKAKKPDILAKPRTVSGELFI